MDINLEMVDEVIQRTGCGYEDAKIALEETDGDVLEAIVKLEKEGKTSKKAEENVVIKRLKELVEKGKVNKIIVKKDDKVLINIPVVAGAVSALFFAGPTFVAIIAAVATGCDLFIITDTGKEYNLNEMTTETFEDLKEKMGDIKDKYKEEHKKEETEDKEESEE